MPLIILAVLTLLWSRFTAYLASAFRGILPKGWLCICSGCSSIQLLTRSTHLPCIVHTVIPASRGNWEPDMGRWVLTESGNEVVPRHKPRLGLKVKTFYCTRLGHLSSELRLRRGTQTLWASIEHWDLSGEAFGGMEAGSAILPLWAPSTPPLTQANKHALIFLVCVCHQPRCLFTASTFSKPVFLL